MLFSMVTLARTPGWVGFKDCPRGTRSAENPITHGVRACATVTAAELTYGNPTIVKLITVVLFIVADGFRASKAYSAEQHRKDYNDG